MDPTGVRTWYVDSRQCQEQDDGSFSLNLWENVELSEGQACYIDDQDHRRHAEQRVLE